MNGPADRIIAVGKTEWIQVRSNSRIRVGNTQDTGANVNVFTNDADHRMVRLSARAKVLYVLRFDPEPTIYGYVAFHDIARTAGAQSQTLLLIRGDGRPLEPRVRSIDVSSVTADLCAVEVGERYELEITVSPPWPDRQIWCKLNLETGVPEQPTITITVSAMIAVGRPGDPADLPPALRERKAPTNCKPVREIICEGPFSF